MKNDKKCESRAVKDQAAYIEMIRPAVLRAFSEITRRPSLRRIAEKLNDMGVPSPRGALWYPETVSRVLKLLGPDFQAEADRASAVAHDRRDAKFWGSENTALAEHAKQFRGGLVNNECP